MGKEKKISCILFWTGIVVVIIAVLFIGYSLNNPQASFSWGLDVTYFIYIVYVVMTIILFVLSNIFSRKNKQNKSL